MRECIALFDTSTRSIVWSINSPNTINKAKTLSNINASPNLILCTGEILDVGDNRETVYLRAYLSKRFVHTITRDRTSPRGTLFQWTAYGELYNSKHIIAWKGSDKVWGYTLDAHMLKEPRMRFEDQTYWVGKLAIATQYRG
jgi:hypothetical protein